MTPRGTVYLAGRNGRMYVAYEDIPEGHSGGFIQIRPDGTLADGTPIYAEFGPCARSLNLARAVVMIGLRLVTVTDSGAYSRHWRKAPGGAR